MVKSRTLPKKIAGVKIPKAVRKSPLGEFAGSKVGQALIAEALMAAIAIVAKQQQDKPQKSKTGAAKGAVSLAPSTLAYACSEAGRAFSEALKGGQPVPPDADWPLEEVGKPRKAKTAPAPTPH